MKSDWPCALCSHPVGEHETKYVRTFQTMYSIDGDVEKIAGPFQIQVFCHAMDVMDTSDGELELEACGCSCYIPVDNLKYLESKLK